MEILIKKYLILSRYFSIPYDDFKLQLLSHPEYPNLKSITDTLDYFGVQNIAATVPTESLIEMPKHFMTILDQNGGDAYSLVTIKGNKVTLNFENAPKRVFSVNTFSEQWSGIVIAIEGIKEHRLKSIDAINLLEPLSLLILSLLLVLSLNPTSWLVSALSIIGTYFAYLIVKEEIGIHSKRVASVCGAINKGGNCAEVINSPGSKIFGIIPLSDLATSYFISLIIINSLIGYDSTFFSAIASAGIPVLLYSLYLQAIVQRKWCALCLGIICTGIFQDFIILSHSTAIQFSLTYFFKAAFVFLLVHYFWSTTKELLISHLELNRTREAFLKFKRKPKLFQTLLKQFPIPNNDLLRQEHQMHFGATNSTLVINAVTNPLCGYCVDAFKTYYKLLKDHKDEIRINFIFNVPYEHYDDIATQIAERILDIYFTQGEAYALNALQNWYTSRDIEEWRKQFGKTEGSDRQYINILKNHKEWCIANKINHTPASVVDGFLFPIEYKTDDLQLLLDEIISESQQAEEIELTKV